METNAERRRRKLTSLCEERGLKEVAERAQVSKASLDQIIKGVLLPPKKDGSRSPRNLGDEAARRIEDAESLGRGWFDDDRGSHEPANQAGSVRAMHPEDGLPDDSVQVPEYKINLSGGNGATAIEYELTEESEPATYRLSWLQRNKLKLSNLKRFKVTGNSMEPLLFHGDSVLVNMAESSLEQIIDGKVYAIRYGDELRVKRLFRRLDGTLTLKSYNHDFKDEDVPPELVSRNITPKLTGPAGPVGRRVSRVPARKEKR